jgi:hypothetical protein
MSEIIISLSSNKIDNGFSHVGHMWLVVLIYVMLQVFDMLLLFIEA